MDNLEIAKIIGEPRDPKEPFISLFNKIGNTSTQNTGHVNPYTVSKFQRVSSKAII